MYNDYKIMKKQDLKNVIKEVVRESLNECEYKQLLKEVSPPGEKSEKMIQHVKASLRKSHPDWSEDKITGVAIATGWKAYNNGSVKEAGLTSETAYKIQGPSSKTFDDSQQFPDAVNNPENA
jgi:hypothetical protein